MLKETLQFREHLEGAIKSWKDQNKLNFPIFYNIDYDNNHLVLYSDKPGLLIGLYGETIHDLDVCLKIANIRFRNVDVKEFKGGVIA